MAWRALGVQFIYFGVVLFYFFTASNPQAAPIPLGVNYGTVADNLPPPSEVVALLKTTIIAKVKLFSVDGTILNAFANSGIEIMVGIGDDQIKPLANGGVPAAKEWVNANVAPYVPATYIAYLSVGNEVLSASDGEMIWDLQFAMENLYTACQELGFVDIKVTTPHSMGLLRSSDPPSNGSFADGAAAILRPILAFLARTRSPYVANAYPFFGYLSNPNRTNLEYALFGADKAPHYDPVTRLSYDNMFDAQVDAVYAAIAALGYDNISVVVGETGWPSVGDEYEPGVSVENAKAFNSNLVRRIVSGRGTPGRPGVPVSAYIFALFNEDLKPGAGSERNWGLFAPDKAPVYDCGIMKLGETNSSSSSSSSSPSPSSAPSSSSSSSSPSPPSAPSSSSSSSSSSPSPSSAPSSSSSSSPSAAPIAEIDDGSPATSAEMAPSSAPSTVQISPSPSPLTSSSSSSSFTASWHLSLPSILALLSCTLI